MTAEDGAPNGRTVKAPLKKHGNRLNTAVFPKTRGLTAVGAVVV
jgi:hypothetical protein